MSARELLEECREEMAGCCDSQRPTRGMEALITRIDAHLSEPVAMPPDACVLEFADFINEPPSYEDRKMVREYRHELAPKWMRVCEYIYALRAWAARGVAMPEPVAIVGEQFGPRVLQASGPLPIICYDALPGPGAPKTKSVFLLKDLPVGTPLYTAPPALGESKP